MAMKPVVWTVGILAVMLVGLVVVVVAVVIALTGRPAHPDRSQAPLTAAAAARAHARRIHVAAWCALVLAMASMAIAASSVRGLESGRITGLVLAAGGLTFLAVSAFGEITWPRPTGSVRTATLHRRTVRDVTPLPAALLLTIASGLLFVALAVGGLTALSDGRSYGRTTLDSGGTVVMAWSSGPYPGWYYGVPLALAASAVLAACAGCLVLIARRPAISETSSAWDLALRQLSAQRMLRGATLTVSATAVPVYGLLALPFLREGPWAVAVLLVLGALASLGTTAAALALPARTLPAEAAEPGPGPAPGFDPPHSGPGFRGPGPAGRAAGAAGPLRRTEGTLP